MLSNGAKNTALQVSFCLKAMTPTSTLGWPLTPPVLDTKNLCPLVAVNPVYMHPFAAAKMVSSFALMYQRKVYLNMITDSIELP